MTFTVDYGEPRRPRPDLPVRRRHYSVAMYAGAGASFVLGMAAGILLALSLDPEDLPGLKLQPDEAPGD